MPSLVLNTYMQVIQTCFFSYVNLVLQETGKLHHVSLQTGVVFSGFRRNCASCSLVTNLDVYVTTMGKEFETSNLRQAYTYEYT